MLDEGRSRVEAACGRVEWLVCFRLKLGFDATSCCVGFMPSAVPTFVPTLPETAAKASDSPMELAVINRALEVEVDSFEGSEGCDAALT